MMIRRANTAVMLILFTLLFFIMKWPIFLAINAKFCYDFSSLETPDSLQSQFYKLEVTTNKRDLRWEIKSLDTFFLLLFGIYWLNKGLAGLEGCYE